jgi:hypothetical protein
MAEPATRHDTEDGKGKFYLHPFRTGDDGQPRRYFSVTTVLDVLNKPGLKWWAAKGAAQRAADNVPKLTVAAFVEGCGHTWKRNVDPVTLLHPRCDQCVDCVTRWVELWHVGKSEERKREGSAIHDVIEQWTYHGTVEPAMAALDEKLRAAIEPYIERFLQYVEDYGLKPESWQACEMTVYHHGHGYAGTLDGIVRFEPVTEKAARLCARITGNARPGHVDVVWDGKSREGEGKALYPEQALQLAAYRFATHALPKQGVAQEVVIPPTQGAVIFQPRPDGYTCEPVQADAYALTAFVEALALYRWQSELGEKSVQVGTFPVPAGFEWTPNGQPAPVKKAAKRAPAKKAVKANARVENATLERIADTGTRGLDDSDIPF